MDGEAGQGAATAPATARGRGITRPLFAVYDRLGHLVREALKFGVVGLIALVVDVGVFNLVRYAGGDGPLHDKPLTAKTISVVVATTVAYFGNRYWTFRHRGRSGLGREYVLFFVLNGVGLGIALGCLAFSHYVLNLTGPLADNISANVVGLVLGTLFRFWSYRRFVFLEVAEDLVPDEPESAAPRG
ncbi:MAG: GtrA family protein [Motilibacteraceae bacterium]